MMQRPYWRSDRANPDDSPFRRGRDERPLLLTIHAPAPSSPCEEESLALIRELAHLEQCDCLDTSETATCRLTIDSSVRSSDGACPFTIECSETTTSSVIFDPDRWLRLAQAFEASAPDKDALVNSLFVAAAHEALRRDLLITTAPGVLSRRDEREMRHVNICPPTEAIKLLGLFLRSRDQFVYAASARARASVDSWSFYLVLRRMAFEAIRQRPELPPPTAAPDPAFSGLRESISIRCRRAIEARDAIGIQFYLRESNRTQDIILYHFDYLTLLLSGALDACMLLARLVHRIDIDETLVGFWRAGFRKALKQDAPGLFEVVESDRAESLRALLSAPRNTIHKARLKSLGYREAGRPAIALVKLSEYGPAARAAAEKLGGCERWGMISSFDFPFEPYSYTLALLDECFRLISAMLEAIEPPLSVPAPPADNRSTAAVPTLFSPDQMRRIGLLG
jgi:hypothetical protein